MNIRFRHIVTLILMLFTLLSATSLPAREKFTLVIDPGHGGRDFGTPHRKCRQDEKTIALNVALRLGRMVENTYPDVRVIYTRQTDVYPTLPERVQKAKKVKGDLFISIHVNACPNASARGFETYVFGIDDSRSNRLEERMVEERENLDLNGRRINFDTDIDIETQILCQAQREKHNKQSLEVANFVHRAIIGQLRRSSYSGSVNDRGVMAKNLFVLCYAPMPAILVELGYMSNVNEERFINTDEAQSLFANALLQGFKQYKSNWDKRQLRNHGSSSASIAEPAPSPQPAPAAPVSDTPAPASTTPAAPTGVVVWKIQFLTSDKLLKPGDREFKGLRNVEHYRDGKVYKYTYGSAPSTSALKQEFKEVRAKFPEAFYVKFSADGQRLK